MWSGGDWELALNVGHGTPLGSPETCPGQQNFGQSTSWNSSDSFLHLRIFFHFLHPDLARHPCHRKRGKRGIKDKTGTKVLPRMKKNGFCMVVQNKTSKLRQKYLDLGDKQRLASWLSAQGGQASSRARNVWRLLLVASNLVREKIILNVEDFVQNFMISSPSHFHNKFMLISWAPFPDTASSRHSKCLKNLNINLNVSTIRHWVGKLSN